MLRKDRGPEFGERGVGRVNRMLVVILSVAGNLAALDAGGDCGRVRSFCALRLRMIYLKTCPERSRRVHSMKRYLEWDDNGSLTIIFGLNKGVGADFFRVRRRVVGP